MRFQDLEIGDEFTADGHNYCKIVETVTNCAGWDSIHNAIKTIDSGDEMIPPKHECDYFMPCDVVAKVDKPKTERDPDIEVWYQWKEIVDCDGVKRMLNVQRDPMVHENSVGELFFDSPEDAKEFLKEQEIEQESGWFVARVIIQPVRD